jgi:hypothetical protein
MRRAFNWKSAQRALSRQSKADAQDPMTHYSCRRHSTTMNSFHVVRSSDLSPRQVKSVGETLVYVARVYAAAQPAEAPVGSRKT